MKLHSKILGQGRPLLILHGFLGMSDNWKSIGNKLSENFQVHLIDQRNHGRSPHSSDFDYRFLADDIKEYCHNHQLENTHLIGHSMGGKTAMFFAYLFPTLVNKLIIADIGPKSYPPHHQKILTGLEALHKNHIKSRKEADQILSQYVKEMGVRMFLLKNLERKGENNFSLRVNLNTLVEKYNQIGVSLPQDAIINGETLFLNGEKSGYILQTDIPMIRNQFTQATFKTIRHAGHWLHAENPKDFTQEVELFLNS